MKLPLKETLIKVWRQAPVEDAKRIELDGEQYPARRTVKHSLRQVDFVFARMRSGVWNRTPRQNPVGRKCHAPAKR
jgi:hypothetical protein